MHDSMGSDEINLWVPRELADELLSHYQLFSNTCGTQVKVPAPAKREI